MEEWACPNAGNAAAADHRQLGSDVWAHYESCAIRTGHSPEEASRQNRSDGQQVNRVEVLATGSHGSDQSP